MGALGKLFGRDADPEKLSGEFKALLTQIRAERNAYEATAVQLKDVAAPIKRVQEQLNQLEQRLAGFGALVTQFAELKQGAAALDAGRQQTEARFGEIKQIAERASGELEALRGKVAEALALKERLPEVLQLADQLTPLKTQIGALDAQLREVTERSGKVGDEQAEIARGGAAAQTQLAAVEKDLQKAATGVGELLARFAKFETTTGQLGQLVKEVPNVKRELGTLNTLAEFVSQKVATLEGQRDTVERAVQRAERLAELAAQVDRQLQEQHTSAKFMSQLSENVGEIKKLHETLLEQAEGIQKKQGAIETENHALEREFTSLRDEVQKAAGQFRFERDGMEAVNQRVVELRDSLAGFQKGLPALEEARAKIGTATSDAERLASQLQGIARHVADLEGHATTARAIGVDIKRLQDAVRDLTSQLATVAPPVTAALDQAEARIAELGQAIASVEERSGKLDRYGERLGQIDHELSARQTAVQQALEQLHKADTVQQATAGILAQLKQESEALLQRLEETKEAGEGAGRLLQELDRRTGQFEEARDRIDRLEARVDDWSAMEERVDRGLELATKRQQAIDAVRTDLQRLFEVADATVKQVRTVAELQKEVDERRESLEAVVAGLRDLDRQTSSIEERKKQLHEAEEHLSRLEALLINLQATLKTALEQKELFERGVETLGSLSFQMMQAESVINTLREEREAAEKGRRK